MQKELDKAKTKIRRLEGKSAFSSSCPVRMRRGMPAVNSSALNQWGRIGKVTSRGG
jgi:hypothetical protein